jgi:hypothetical protein
MLGQIKKWNTLFLCLACLLLLKPYNVSANYDSEVLSATDDIVLSKDERQRAKVQIGTLKIWVTNSPKRLNWQVTMRPPYNATGFKGTWNITDIYHGSIQRTNISGLKGYISQPMLKSQYMASLSGKVIPTGYALGSSSIRWNN